MEGNPHAKGEEDEGGKQLAHARGGGAGGREGGRRGGTHTNGEGEERQRKHARTVRERAAKTHERERYETGDNPSLTITTSVHDLVVFFTECLMCVGAIRCCTFHESAGTRLYRFPNCACAFISGCE